MKVKTRLYAVRELYQKMYERVTQQKQIRHEPSYTIPENYSATHKNTTSAITIVSLSILAVCVAVNLVLSMRLVTVNSNPRTGAKEGYYEYNNRDYYFDGSNWYYYAGDYWEPYYGDTSTWYSDEYYVDDDFYGYAFDDWYEDEYGDYYWEDDDHWDSGYDDWYSDWDSDYGWDDDYDWDYDYDDWDSDW